MAHGEKMVAMLGNLVVQTRLFHGTSSIIEANYAKVCYFLLEKIKFMCRLVMQLFLWCYIVRIVPRYELLFVFKLSYNIGALWYKY
jgi:hypothetical protein